MKKIKVYGTILEVNGIMYDFTEFKHNKDCQFLLDVVDKFNSSNKHCFYDVKKQVVDYLIKCYELKKAPKLDEIL